jgi:hypothetical protein
MQTGCRMLGEAPQHERTAIARLVKGRSYGEPVSRPFPRARGQPRRAMLSGDNNRCARDSSLSGLASPCSFDARAHVTSAPRARCKAAVRELGPVGNGLRAVPARSVVPRNGTEAVPYRDSRRVEFPDTLDTQVQRLYRTDAPGVAPLRDRSPFR